MGTREDRLTEAMVIKALKNHWSPWHGNGWIIVPHVRCQTGYGEHRCWSDIKTRKAHRRFTDATIDALAFNAWPSKGNALHGLEIKLSRADWLRELRDPVKSEVMRKQVDKMFVVAPPGVVCQKKDKDVLGTQWGYYEIQEVKPPGSLGADGKMSMVALPTGYQTLRFRKMNDCKKLPGSVGADLPRAFVTAILRADLKQQGE